MADFKHSLGYTPGKLFAPGTGYVLLDGAASDAFLREVCRRWNDTDGAVLRDWITREAVAITGLERLAAEQLANAKRRAEEGMQSWSRGDDVVFRARLAEASMHQAVAEKHMAEANVRRDARDRLRARAITAAEMGTATEARA